MFGFHSRREKTIDLARRCALYCVTDRVLGLTYAKSVTFAHPGVPKKRVPRCPVQGSKPIAPCPTWALALSTNDGIGLWGTDYGYAWAVASAHRLRTSVRLHYRSMTEPGPRRTDSGYAWAVASAQRMCTPVHLRYRPMTELALWGTDSGYAWAVASARRDSGYAWGGRKCTAHVHACALELSTNDGISPKVERFRLCLGRGPMQMSCAGTT